MQLHIHLRFEGDGVNSFQEGQAACLYPEKYVIPPRGGMQDSDDYWDVVEIDSIPKGTTEVYVVSEGSQYNLHTYTRGFLKLEEAQAYLAQCHAAGLKQWPGHDDGEIDERIVKVPLVDLHLAEPTQKLDLEPDVPEATIGVDLV